MFLYGFSSGKNGNKKVNEIEIEFEEGGNEFLTQHG